MMSAWFSNKRLAAMDASFKARTGNMPEEMREAEWAEELERGWQEIQKTVLAFRVAGGVLNGGRFDALSLGTWVSIVSAADLTYVPIAPVGFAELNKALAGEPVALRLPDDAKRYRGMVRLDCCGTAALKAEMSVRGDRDQAEIIGAKRMQDGWSFDFDERTVNQLMAYVGQIEAGGHISCPIWWRPWVSALETSVPRPAFMGKRAGSDAWPIEWRAIVQRGALVAISAYYIQAPVVATDEVMEHIASVAKQVRCLLAFMVERGIQPWHPRYIGEIAEDETAFTCDFISTPSGPAFLEAGPYVPVDERNIPVPEWGAHPCCFIGREVKGVLLSRESEILPLPACPDPDGEGRRERMTMVERVIASKRDLVPFVGIDRRGERGWFLCEREECERDDRPIIAGPFSSCEDAEAEVDRINARAAIAAMREPTEAMENVEVNGHFSPSLHREVWNEMVDAALKEPAHV